MSTLLMRLSAPIQSWGTEVRYDICTTRREPTKSGVLGMIAAAMGCHRDAFPTHLNQIRFGVRVDREGVLLQDFHTARPLKGSPYVTRRYYLCDAVFLAGLEGDENLLLEIAHALSHPYYPLYLGRRSCPPAGRVVLGIRGYSLIEALRSEPSLLESDTKNDSLRVLVDAEQGDPSVRLQRDAILSLDIRKRQYGYRGVREFMIPSPDSPVHDPMAELEG